jgi:hypothetical protein
MDVLPHHHKVKENPKMGPSVHENFIKQVELEIQLHQAVVSSYCVPVTVVDVGLERGCLLLTPFVYWSIFF